MGFILIVLLFEQISKLEETITGKQSRIILQGAGV